MSMRVDYNNLDNYLANKDLLLMGLLGVQRRRENTYPSLL